MAGEPLRMAPGSTSPGRPLCAVTMTPLPTFRWPELADWPAKMQLSPTMVEPARPTWPQSRVWAPTFEA